MNLQVPIPLRRAIVVLGLAALAACGGGGGGGDAMPGATQTTVTLATNPAGLALTLDGQPAPASFQSAAGSEHTLSASNQNANGRRWVFASWSDGGAATHTITTPSTATTYTATFTDGGSATGTAPSVVILTTNSNARVGVAAQLSVTAIDQDNDIVKVEFLDNGVVIAEDTSSPYSFSWTPTTSGVHPLRARAVDAQGLSTQSAIVNVTVAP